MPQLLRAACQKPKGESWAAQEEKRGREQRESPGVQCWGGRKPSAGDKENIGLWGHRKVGGGGGLGPTGRKTADPRAHQKKHWQNSGMGGKLNRKHCGTLYDKHRALGHTGLGGSLKYEFRSSEGSRARPNTNWCTPKGLRSTPRGSVSLFA